MVVEITKEAVIGAIRPVIDPEIGLGIVDLGLVYDGACDEAGVATVRMTLTSPACPMGPQIMADVKNHLERLPGVREVRIDLVWSPPWDPRKMASDEVKMQLGLFDDEPRP
jgi:metal-sulfur cluster biosynthetic enzyme